MVENILPQNKLVRRTYEKEGHNFVFHYHFLCMIVAGVLLIEQHNNQAAAEKNTLQRNILQDCRLL